MVKKSKIEEFNNFILDNHLKYALVIYRLFFFRSPVVFPFYFVFCFLNKAFDIIPIIKL